MGVEHGDDKSYEEVYAGSDTQTAVDVPVGTDRLAFRVRAESPGVVSGWTQSAPLSASGKGGDTPTLSEPQVGDTGEVRLAWSAVEAASGYLLEAARDEAFADPRTVEGQGTTATFRPPASGDYWFRVRARRTDGTPGPAGNTRRVRVHRPAAPKLWPVDPVPADQPFDVTWTGIPGIVYYEVQVATNRDFTGDIKTARAFHPQQKKSISGRSSGPVHVRVKAVDESQQASPWSETIIIDIM
jgi:hypothetical protein